MGLLPVGTIWQPDPRSTQPLLNLSVGIALLKGRTKAKEAPAWTAGARVELQELVRRELEHLPATMESLEPKDRIAILCKLLPYALPRLSNVEGKEAPRNEWPFGTL